MQDFVFFVTKYTAIYVCAVYAYAKLIKCKLCPWDLLDVPVYLVLSSLLYFVNTAYSVLGDMCLVVTALLFLLIRFRHNFQCILSAGLMSLGITMYLRFPTYAMFLPINALLYLIDDVTLRGLLVNTAFGAMQITLMYFIFKIKWLRHRINFNDRSVYSFLLNIANVLCILAALMINTDFMAKSLFELGEFAVTFFGILILFLYRRNGIDGYIKQQTLIERALVEKSVEVFGKQVYALERENETMGKIIHRDNKILPALETAVSRTLVNYKDDRLTEILQTVCRYDSERGADIAQLHERVKIPQTGVAMIDAILYELSLQCERETVAFDLEILSNVEEWFVCDKPDRTSMNVLLSYLGDNAVKAASAARGGKMKIILGGAQNNAPFLRVYDNGEQFAPKVLAHMGVERITTRKDKGGKGYGLQTLFETLRRFNASLTLNETCGAPYTKYIEVYFDGEHRITLRSDRKKAIKAVSGRSDITVIKP